MFSGTLGVERSVFHLSPGKCGKQTRILEKGEEIMFERKKTAGKIYSLPVESIHPSPYQARTSFDERELAGLAQSIRENGLLQPISVRKLSLIHI